MDHPLETQWKVSSSTDYLYLETVPFVVEGVVDSVVVGGVFEGKHDKSIGLLMIWLIQVQEIAELVVPLFAGGKTNKHKYIVLIIIIPKLI